MQTLNGYLVPALGVSLSLAAACATVPKPQELVELEKLAQTKGIAKAKKTQPDLINASMTSRTLSTEAWEDEELELSKYYASLGQVQAQTALRKEAQAKTRQSIEKTDKKINSSETYAAKLDKEIAELNEKLALYGQLDEKTTAAKTQATLSGQIDEAAAAIAAAEAMNAATFAEKELAEAKTQLVTARESRNQQKLDAAAQAAGRALIAAKQAQVLAAPKFKDAQTKANVAERDAALQRELAMTGGVEPKLKRVGTVKQVVLPVLAAFKPKAGEMVEARASLVSRIGAVLKKFDDYKVIVNGFTSYRTRKSERYSMSQTRAQDAANRLIAAGVASDRVAVSGRGAEELANRRRYSNDNDRVEISVVLKGN